MHFFVRIYADALCKGQNHFLRQQLSEFVDKVFIGIGAEIGEQTRIQFLFIQCRFKVDEKGCIRKIAPPHMRGGGENRRTADTEVREKHFSEVTINGFAA